MNYSTYGITTSQGELKLAQITRVGFIGDTLAIRLNDGRSIHLDMADYTWLAWLLKATPEQRSQWEIVPSGGGVWWAELDNGIELQPLLDMQPLR
jgi:hypothetical protein